MVLWKPMQVKQTTKPRAQQNAAEGVVSHTRNMLKAFTQDLSQYDSKIKKSLSDIGKPVADLPPLLLHTWAKLRTRHVHLFFCAVSNLVRQHKHQTLSKQRQRMGVEVELVMDPTGVERGWGGGLEILDAAEYDGTCCGVWSPSQLRSMVELFQLFTVLSVWELQTSFSL